MEVNKNESLRRGGGGGGGSGGGGWVGGGRVLSYPSVHCQTCLRILTI